MDSKGAWRDNVFVERLWRSVKYEEVYLRANDRVAEAIPCSWPRDETEVPETVETAAGR